MKAHEEIMNALRFYFGDDITDDSINEIIGQAHDPIDTISKALDDYRACEG
ncbi:hypothetical protein [Serratia ficaria]|uniref:hypothetical protein n=1 Tax=Serratia ficaria TaxID=61651 RepID=UPI0021786555|nr:hypothetical protein [Serratia ficaria]CAI1022003.1 Uncharacterised protein [Serratia ficaria]